MNGHVWGRGGASWRFLSAWVPTLMCSHCVFGSHLSTQAMSYDIIGAVEQARDVACIAYVHHGRKASLRKVSLDIVALAGSSRCHKLQQHSWESALHARDAKTFLRAHTEKLKSGREADIKVKKFNDKIAIRHSDVINLSFGTEKSDSEEERQI